MSLYELMLNKPIYIDVNKLNPPLLGYIGVNYD